MKKIKRLLFLMIVIVFCISCSLDKPTEQEYFLEGVTNNLEDSFLHDKSARRLFEEIAIESIRLLGDHSSCYFPYENKKGSNYEFFYYNDYEDGGKAKTDDSLRLNQKTIESIKELLRIHPFINIGMINVQGCHPCVQFSAVKSAEKGNESCAVQQILLFTGKDDLYFEKKGYKRISEGWYSKQTMQAIIISDEEKKQSEEMSLYEISSICKKLIQDDSFLQFVRTVETDSKNADTVYMIDYDHTEYPDLPNDIHIHKPGILNSTVTSATEIPGEQLTEAFHVFEENHGPFTECDYVTVYHGEYGETITFTISYSTSHRLNTYLVKGDPVNALCNHFWFTDPDIGMKRTMEFILIADGWYVICFY